MPKPPLLTTEPRASTPAPFNREQGAKQRRTEAALQVSEARFEAVFDKAAFGIALVGMDGHPQRCNPALERILGYSEAELQAMTFAQFTHPEDVATDVALFEELRRGDRAEYHIDKRYIRKDGRIVWALLSVSVLRDATGEPTCVLGMAEDVTTDRNAQVERERLLRDLQERVKEETALHATIHRSEERLKLALGAAAMGIWEWDFATNRVTLSEELEGIAGLEPGGFPATFDAFQSLVHADDRLAVQRALRLAIDDASYGDAFEAEFRLMRPDGSHRWVASRARVLRDEGRPTRMLGMAHDISRLRQLEQQFHQAQKMEAVGRLAGGVAHDFNNLLTAIKGYSELLIEDLPPGDKRRADVEEIAAAADRATALTGQLLAFSRSQVLDPKIVNPNDIVTGMEKLLRRLIGSDIEFQVTLAPAPGAVRVDPGQLEQVIMNLAVNARDAMPDGGTLTIRTSVVEFDERMVEQRMDLAPGRYIVLAVSDTGTGMTPEVRARLFEPFFTTKEKGRGTGLGLSTAHGIVHQSGGAIWVYGEPGQGTTFKVYLPWVSSPADGTAVAPPKVLSTRGTETIALVDDDPQVRALSERALRAQGYHVFPFANGLEAVQFVRTTDTAIDLLVTDVVMPRMPGPELAGHVRAARPAVRVLYLTGYTDRVIEPGSRPNVLQKPFAPSGLLRTVREILDRPLGSGMA